MASYQATFSFSLKGNTTKEVFFGKFTAKTLLTTRDFIAKDQIRRQILGGAGTTTDAYAGNLAILCSECAVRVIDGPKWWKDSDNGMDLADDNVLKKVFDECIRLEVEAVAAQDKAAEEAATQLKEEVAKMPSP
jgi:hypothetical protein